MQRMDEALQYMYRSIDLLKDSDNVRELAYLSTYYGDLSGYLYDNHHNDEAIEICQQRLNVIHRMSRMPGPPPGYIDQQYGYLYSKLALYYRQEEKPKSRRGVPQLPRHFLFFLPNGTSRNRSLLVA